MRTSVRVAALSVLIGLLTLWFWTPSAEAWMTEVASCVPSNSLSVLLDASTGDVSAYVPNSNWFPTGKTGIEVVPVEGTGVSPATIPTPNLVNSCASNSATGETVCVANNTDVYLITGSTLNTTLTSGATGTAAFSGGSCQNCGVAINAMTNTAVLGIGLASGSGYQFLDLGSNTLSTPIASTNGISEAILWDPVLNLALSPNENGNYELLQTAPTTALFDNQQPGTPTPPTFDSAAEDCGTGIALATDEGTSDLYITDLTQATFTPGSPGTWSAPSQFQDFPEFSTLSAGTNGIAVAQGTQLGIVTGEFGGKGFGAIQLPATSGSGTPAVVDWVAASMPNDPNGNAWQMGLDPHTVTAYTSPTSGLGFGLIANLGNGSPPPTGSGPTFLAAIDLQALLSAPRVAGQHTVDPSVDLVGTGIVRFIAVTDPNGGDPAPQVATPTFSPAAGTYAAPLSVTLSDATGGARIYYTTDGSMPTTSSTPYTRPISVRTSTTITAMAAASGMANSTLASATYTIQVATPAFSPAAGTYSAPLSVTLSDATGGATVYYTTDGSTPTTSSNSYTGPISVTATTTITAMAAASGMANSNLASATYTLQAATPTFSPGGGTYLLPQTVSISDASPGVTIYYTTDGSTPTTSSAQYTGPILVIPPTTLSAMAVAPGWSQSPVASATYSSAVGLGPAPGPGL